jgi:hypothetical protein
MCLEVLAQIADTAPGKIGAKRLGELSGLVISSSRLDGLPALHFSVSGGCSCEFLARGPHKHVGTWELDPTQLAKLAVAIRALNSEARKYRFVAHWLGGETERTERRITGKELLRLVEENQVGDNVIYRTWSDGSK